MPEPLTLSMPSAFIISIGVPGRYLAPVLRISTRRMVTLSDFGVILMPSRPVSRISRSSSTTSDAPCSLSGPPWYQLVCIITPYTLPPLSSRLWIRLPEAVGSTWTTTVSGPLPMSQWMCARAPGSERSSSRTRRRTSHSR